MQRRFLALALLTLPLGGCDQLFGIIHVQDPPPPDGDTGASMGLDNGYTCECTCTYQGGGSASRALPVCMTADTNPNLNGGTVPPAQSLIDDCANRVEIELQAMNDTCYKAEKPVCTCTTATPLPDTFYDASCDQGCPTTALDGTCSNWDFKTGVKTATCADSKKCADPGPVCVKQGVDPAVLAPTPLAGGINGHTTTCRIDDGDVAVTADDQTATSPMIGLVNFAPAPAGSCLPGETCLTMDYRLDATDTLHFDGFLGFGDTDIEHVVTSGASSPFVLPSTNTAFLPESSTQTSGRAYEDGDRYAAFGENANRVVVTMDGTNCSVQGNLTGNVGDPNGDNADAAMVVHVFGDVENTPPTADAGDDQTVECTSPDGADVTLDASGSADAQSNIVSYGWYAGSRTNDAGSGSSLTLTQALGDQDYTVKVIDGDMQSDEDDVTVHVVDTTAPTVHCNAPATITPSKTPYTFKATASDLCDGSLATPSVIGYACYSTNGSGKRVPKDCVVRYSGDTFTVVDSSGIGTIFDWRVQSVDDQGNTTTTTCETQVVRR